MARKLLEEDEEEEDEDGDKHASKADQTHNKPSASGEKCDENTETGSSSAAADEVEMVNANDNS